MLEIIAEVLLSLSVSRASTIIVETRRKKSHTSLGTALTTYHSQVTQTHWLVILPHSALVCLLLYAILELCHWPESNSILPTCSCGSLRRELS